MDIAKGVHEKKGENLRSLIQDFIGQIDLISNSTDKKRKKISERLKRVMSDLRSINKRSRPWKNAKRK